MLKRTSASRIREEPSPPKEAGVCRRLVAAGELTSSLWTNLLLRAMSLLQRGTGVRESLSRLVLMSSSLRRASITSHLMLEPRTTLPTRWSRMNRFQRVLRRKGLPENRAKVEASPLLLPQFSRRTRLWTTSNWRLMMPSRQN